MAKKLDIYYVYFNMEHFQNHQLAGSCPAVLMWPSGLQSEQTSVYYFCIIIHTFFTASCSVAESIFLRHLSNQVDIDINLCCRSCH